MPAALSLSPSRSWRASAPASYEKQVPTTSKTTEGIVEMRKEGRRVEKVRVWLMEREIQTRSLDAEGQAGFRTPPIPVNRAHRLARGQRLARI